VIELQEELRPDYDVATRRQLNPGARRTGGREEDTGMMGEVGIQEEKSKKNKNFLAIVRVCQLRTIGG
jgi:hypothetical protein